MVCDDTFHYVLNEIHIEFKSVFVNEIPYKNPVLRGVGIIVVVILHPQQIYRVSHELNGPFGVFAASHGKIEYFRDKLFIEAGQMPSQDVPERIEVPIGINGMALMQVLFLGEKIL